MHGSIYLLRLNKGFGFIRGEDRNSYFFHAKEVVPRIAFDTLREGLAVEFNATRNGPVDKDGEPGFRAEQVKITSGVEI